MRLLLSVKKLNPYIKEGVNGKEESRKEDRCKKSC